MLGLAKARVSAHSGDNMHSPSVQAVPAILRILPPVRAMAPEG
ncbi:MAG: hypothetical protein ACE5HX_17860 [bacterium]